MIEFRHVQDSANYLCYGMGHKKVVHKEQLHFSDMVFLKPHNLKCDSKNVHGPVSLNIKFLTAHRVKAPFICHIH